MIPLAKMEPRRTPYDGCRLHGKELLTSLPTVSDVEHYLQPRVQLCDACGKAIAECECKAPLDVTGYTDQPLADQPQVVRQVGAVVHPPSDLRKSDVVGGMPQGRKVAAKGQHERTTRAKKGAGGKKKGGPVKQENKNAIIFEAKRVIVEDNIDKANPETVPEHVEIEVPNENDNHDLDEGVGTGRVKRNLKLYFQVSEFPVNNALFSGGESPIRGYHQLDCGGRGFCGLVAIDTALGKERNISEYVERAFGRNDMGFEEMVLEAPALVGTADYLYSFSLARGVNLLLLDNMNRSISRFQHHANWKWVHLRYLTRPQVEGVRVSLGLPNAHNTFIGPRNVDYFEPGHFYLLTESYSSHDVVPSLVKEAFERVWFVPIPAVGLFMIMVYLLGALFVYKTQYIADESMLLQFVVMTIWFLITAFGFSLGLVKISFHRKVVFGETMFADSNIDTRNFIDRRDRLKAQECYCFADVDQWWRVRLCRRVLLLRSPTVLWRMFSCISGLDNSELPRVVEIERYRVIAGDMVKNSHLGSVEKNLNSYGAIRELNSSSNLHALSTLSVLSEFAQYVNDTNTRVAPDTALIQFNVHGTTSVVPNIDNVVINQIIGAGFDAYSCADAQQRGARRNHVRNGEYRQGDDKVTPVAITRRPLYTADGVMTCGIFFHHNEWSALLGAWMTRGMTKGRSGQDGKFKGQCIAWGRKMFETIINDSDVHPVLLTGPFEERNIQAFELAYSKKRPKFWVDMMVQDYRKYLSRKMTRREEEKFRQHGYFIKFESNSKWVLVDGERKIKGRPRGIMTMSPLMMFECAQCIDLLHQLYATDLKLFQVKNMTPQEICDAVYKHTQNGMMVTDVSAFESSIDEDLRRIEDHVMFLLCFKAQCMDVYEKYCEWTNPYRMLRTAYGVMMNSTRNSGDFWTSAFNGVDMLSLVFYEHVLTYNYLSRSELLVDKIEFKRIVYDKFYGLYAKVEGDDGLVRPGAITSENMAKCGIAFSSALVGTRPGDVDFLRSRWMDGKRYVNIGRALGAIWLKGANHLSFGKQEFLRRMVALSMYWLQPGHPVLTGWINRTERETRRFNNFKNSRKYLTEWKFDEGIVSKSFPVDIKVDESMRANVAMGAAGFPPISISNQIELERMFEQDDVFYVARLFDHYEDVTDRVAVGSGQLDLSETDFYSAVVKSGIKLSGERKLLPDTCNAKGQVVAETKKGK